jgi:hypothetical protein
MTKVEGRDNRRGFKYGWKENRIHGRIRQNTGFYIELRSIIQTLKFEQVLKVLVSVVNFSAFSWTESSPVSIFFPGN